MAYSIYNIQAWQKSHEFTLMVYKATKLFPDFERFELSSQFQRAAVSIIANIAEGSRRLTKPDKLHFMHIAQGSLEECRCNVILSKDLEYVTEDAFNAMTQCINDASRLLNGFTKGIEKSDFSSNL